MISAIPQGISNYRPSAGLIWLFFRYKITFQTGAIPLRRANPAAKTVIYIY